MTGAPLAVNMASQNLTPSPLADLGEFLFPAADDATSGMLASFDSPRTEEDIFGGMMLLEQEQNYEGEVEFGEVFTDINSLLTVACSSSVSFDGQHQGAAGVTAGDLPLDVTAVVPDNDSTSVPLDVQILAISEPQGGVEQYVTVDPEMLTTLYESTITVELPSVSAEPDHSYSTVKQTRKRNYSEVSFDDEVVDKKSLKYLERRRKNNIASKRSREIRKNKFLSMDEEAAELEKANAELREKIEQLESLTKRMKEALVAKLSTAK